MNQQLNTTTQHTPIATYQHDTRPEWGTAIIAWEKSDRRGYQFEDGQLRIFTSPHYHRLVEVDRPLATNIALAAQLQRKLEHEPLPRAATVSASRRTTTLSDQLRLFTLDYPAGFDDPAWRARIRGIDAKRRIKRHREPAISDAGERLSASRLDRLIAEGRFADAWSDVLTVLGAVDLVSKRRLDQVRNLGMDDQRRLVIAVRELLWGEDRYALRFERFVGALAAVTGREPSWQLATALPALVHPGEHICVRPTSFRAQAQWMAPRLAHTNIPEAALYDRYLSMAREVRAELIDAGQAPRDLLDVHDFMWATLRPSAVKRLEALPRDVAVELKQAA